MEQSSCRSPAHCKSSLGPSCLSFCPLQGLLDFLSLCCLSPSMPGHPALSPQHCPHPTPPPSQRQEEAQGPSPEDAAIVWLSVILSSSLLFLNLERVGEKEVGTSKRDSHHSAGWFLFQGEKGGTCATQQVGGPPHLYYAKEPFILT